MIDLNQKPAGESEKKTPAFGESRLPKKRNGCLRIVGIVVIALSILAVIGAVGGYFYWQSVKKTPQYSLALIVDAARRDDKEKLSQLIDTESVVKNFTPQIADQAVELYGRGLPSAILGKISGVIAPLMPAIKEKVKDELPGLIRDKTARIDKIPYWAIAMFADRALSVKIEGDNAEIVSKDADQVIQMSMTRDGGVWKVTSVTDEKLARKIAEKVGQQMLSLVGKGSIANAAQQIGVDGLGDMLKNLNNIFKK